VKINSRDSVYNVLFFLLVPYLFVDSLNGALIRQGYFSISIIYKLLILALMVYYLRSKPLILFVGGVMLFYFIVHTAFLGDPVTAGKGLNFLFKFLAIVIFYVFFTQVIRNGNENWIFALAAVSFAILAMNLILGVFGFGYPQYYAGAAQGIGSRGFIFAGNELACALVVAGSLIMMRFLSAGRFRAFLFCAVFFVGVSARATSKVTMLSSLILFLVFPAIYGINRKRLGKLNEKDKRFIFWVIIIVPLAGFGAITYALFQMNLFSRLVYYYHKTDLITVVFSHRNVWVVQALNAFASHYSIPQWLFGDGRGWWAYISGGKIVEIDPIDVLMTYGVSGVVLVYGFFLFVFYRVVKSRNQKNPYAFYVAFTLFLLMGISFTAGHVIYSGIAGPLLGALMALVCFEPDFHSGKPLRMLMVSNMYPSERQPVYGIFVRNFEEAMKLGGIVVAKVVIRGRGRNVLEKLYKYVCFTFEVWLRLFKESYDLIYVHFGNHSLLPLIPVVSLANRPLIVNFHGNDFYPAGFFARQLLKLNSATIRGAFMLVVPSGYFKMKVIDKYAHSNVYVSYSGGVDFSLFRLQENKPVDSSLLTIGYVSRIDEGKGWDFLIRALNRIKKEKPQLRFRVVLAGGGEQTGSMKKMIHELGLEADVRYAGVLEQVRLPSLYRSFDVFVFPTVREAESLGLVGLEAMACGVPVIGSRIGGLKEYICHGENGFFFEPGNVRELADKIVMFANLTEDKRQALSRQAAESAAAYDSAVLYGELIKKIRGVLG